MMKFLWVHRKWACTKLLKDSGPISCHKRSSLYWNALLIFPTLHLRQFKFFFFFTLFFIEPESLHTRTSLEQHAHKDSEKYNATRASCIFASKKLNFAVNFLEVFRIETTVSQRYFEQRFLDGIQRKVQVYQCKIALIPGWKPRCFSFLSKDAAMLLLMQILHLFRPGWRQSFFSPVTKRLKWGEYFFKVARGLPNFSHIKRKPG